MRVQTRRVLGADSDETHIRGAGASIGSNDRFVVLAIITLFVAVVVSVVPVTQVGAAPTGWTVTKSKDAKVSGVKMPTSLLAASCASSTDCTSVGYWVETVGSSTYNQALIESYDGGSWNTVAAKNLSGSSATLAAVSCKSSSFCVAAGSSDSETTEDLSTLVEMWNGNKWSIAKSPDPDSDDWLEGVSCVSSRFCMAVGGDVGSSGVDATNLALEWNGRSWSEVVMPTGSGSQNIEGVSCASTSFCVAVGSDKGTKTFIETWDGTDWSIGTSPNKGKEMNNLIAVSCVSPTRCQAVGRFKGDNSLFETWNGKSWALAVSSDPKAGPIEAVSCTSGSDCVAVGFLDGPLVENWDGRTWSVATSVDPGHDAYLDGVSCTGSTNCQAVGGYDPAKAPDPSAFAETGG